MFVKNFLKKVFNRIFGDSNRLEEIPEVPEENHQPVAYNTNAYPGDNWDNYSKNMLLEEENNNNSNNYHQQVPFPNDGYPGDKNIQLKGLEELGIEDERDVYRKMLPNLDNIVNNKKNVNVYSGDKKNEFKLLRK